MLQTVEIKVFRGRPTSTDEAEASRRRPGGRLKVRGVRYLRFQRRHNLVNVARHSRVKSYNL